MQAKYTSKRLQADCSGVGVSALTDSSHKEASIETTDSRPTLIMEKNSSQTVENEALHDNLLMFTACSISSRGWG